MISIEKFRDAAARIQDNVIRTPLVHSPTLSRHFEGEIFLKLENLQKTGSFKVRGASYKVLTCLKEIGPAGIVAASAGNHAQGVALAAKQAGVPATVVMPEWASITKQAATQDYGGRVVIEGQNLQESLAKARALAQEGRLFVHPFDDRDIITGQGTIALEILEDLADADMIVAPIGGGGLISGLALAAKALRPQVTIVGVQAAVCPSAYDSRRKGRITQVVAQPSIADGISVKQVGELTFDVMRQSVDDVVLVEEQQIAAAILMLLERKKILAEGSGAVGLAALLNGAITVTPGSKVVLVISGGNVDSPLLGRIISQGLLKNGRIMRLSVRVEDTPGNLSKLLSLVAAQKANVLHIYHDRSFRNLPIYVTRVELELETRGPGHVKEIAANLQGAGYELKIR